MPQIKKRSYGIVEVQKTGMENFLDALSSGLQTYVGLKDRKKQEQEKIQNMIEDLEKRRIDFLKLDPELQEQLKKEAPGTIADLFDNDRILRMQGKKPQGGPLKPLQARLPPTRERTTTESADLNKRLAESRKAIAESAVTESAAPLAISRNESFLNDLKNPENAAGQYAAKYGKPPSMDELQAFMATDPAIRTQINQKTQGTIEFKTNQRDQEFSRMVQQYQPKNQKEMDQLKQAASYMYGLADQMPAALPQSAEQQRLRMEQQRLNISESELGLSRARLAKDIGESKLKTVQLLVDNGMPVGDATKTATQVLESGLLPTGMQVPADKKKAVELQIAELQAKKLAAEVLEQSIINPKVKVQLDLMRMKVSDAPAGQYGLEDADIKKLLDLAGIPSTAGKRKAGWMKEAWDQMLSKLSGGSAPASGGTAAAPAPAAKPVSSGKPLTPETEKLVVDMTDNWESILRTSGDDRMVKKVRDKLTRLRVAIAAGDENAIRQIILE
jgi:hypothetical protein